MARHLLEIDDLTGDEVKAVLTSAANKSEIKVRCADGAVAAEIKETPPKAGPVRPAAWSTAGERGDAYDRSHGGSA